VFVFSEFAEILFDHLPHSHMLLQTQEAVVLLAIVESMQHGLLELQMHLCYCYRGRLQ
jgi:hypothetical protein